MVDLFLEDGIDQGQFDRIRFRVEASEIYSEYDNAGLARTTSPT